MPSPIIAGGRGKNPCLFKWERSEVGNFYAKPFLLEVGWKVVVEELLPARMAPADPTVWGLLIPLPTHPRVGVVPSELCKVREATGDAGSRTSAVAVCMVGLGACGTEEVSHVDGKVIRLQMPP